MTPFASPKKFIGLVNALAIKTIKLRYKNSILGFVWSLMNPLIYLVIFTVVFTHAFPQIEKYPLYALTGLVFWMFFSSSTIQVIESVINNSGIQKSINIPNIAFPLAAQLASIINLGLSLIPFTILMFVFGLQLSGITFFAIPVLLFYTAFTFGISLVLCSLNVYFRDMQLAWGSFLPAIFYASPIAYTANLIPEKFIWVVKLNPIFHFITAFRDVLYHNQLPTGNQVLLIMALGTLSLLIGLLCFNRLKKGFVSQF